MLVDQAERYGDKPFLLFEDETISYREMCDRASRFAAPDVLNCAPLRRAQGKLRSAEGSACAAARLLV